MEQPPFAAATPQRQPSIPEGVAIRFTSSSTGRSSGAGVEEGSRVVRGGASQLPGLVVHGAGWSLDGGQREGRRGSTHLRPPLPPPVAPAAARSRLGALLPGLLDASVLQAVGYARD